MIPENSRATAVADAALSWLVEGAWLDGRRMRAYSLILLVITLASVVTVAVAVSAKLPAGVTAGFLGISDFNSFYAAGTLADAGHPTLAYDMAAHRAAEREVSGADAAYNFFFYPPMLLPFCAAVAALPYVAAFGAWAGGQLLLYVTAARAILGRWSAVLPIVAFPSVAWAVAMGQNALLSAGLLGWGTVLLERRRPFAAGLAFGAMCYKPHLALAVPFALAAGREWRALAGFAAGVAGIAALATATFGWEIWGAYLSLFAGSAPKTFVAGPVPHAYLISVAGAILMLGGGKIAAYVAQAAATSAAIWLAARIWRGCTAAAPRAIALLAANLLAAPVILFYDIVPAALCVAWMARDARGTGWLPWEKAVVVALFGLSLAGRELAIGLHIPYGPAAALALMAVALRRADLRKRVPDCAESAA